VRKLIVGLLVFALVGVGSTVWAGGTAAEAEAMVQKGLDFIKANGKDKALEAFSNPAGEFVKGDLYLFIVDDQGMTLAHGGNPKLVGKNMAELKDADGKLFIKAMMDLSHTGGGWVDYKWTNPETKKVQDKSTFVKPIEGMGAFLGCGIYK
jgi:cytochrome c